MARLFTRQAREQEQRDELLSAYLDDQLGAGERARLEARLATDPALRAELDALRGTVALVRDLPPVPIPRNFILPQEVKTTMAAPPQPARPARWTRPRRAWAAPFLTAATAVVSLLFVVVLAGDLLLLGSRGAAFAPAAEPLLEAEAPQVALEPSLISEEVVVEAEVEAEEVEKVIPAATPLPVPMEVPPEAGASATAEAEDYAVEAVEDAEATPSAMGGGGLTEEPAAPAPMASPPAVEEAAVAPTALPTATATPEPERVMGDAEPTPSEEAEVAPLWVEEEEVGTAEGERGAPESKVAEPATVSPWRVLEAVLGLTTLGLALATVWAWRVRRR